MGFLDRLLTPGVEVRNEVIGTSFELSEYFKRFGFGSNSSAGISINPQSALSQTTVFTCINILAQTVGMLPLNVYRSTNEDGKRRRDLADDLGIFDLLHLKPNQFQTAFGFKSMMQGHVALTGNAYAFANKLRSGKIAELIPLHPNKVSVEVDENWNKVFKYQNPKGGTDTYTIDQVLHVMGLSSDGFVGMSPIAFARNAIGLGLATELHGSRFFSGGGKPGGVLTHPKELGKEARVRLADDFDRDNQGEKSGRTLLLEDGLGWTQIGLSNEESQFLETRNFQRAEIASWWRIPPHMVNDLSRTIQANITELSRSFLINTLMPWLVNWEQSIDVTLLASIEKNLFSKFTVQAMLRGDAKSRAEFYKAAINDGYMNRNEVRALEEMNPVDGLDEFLTPLNMREGSDASANEDE